MKGDKGKVKRGTTRRTERHYADSRKSDRYYGGKKKSGATNRPKKGRRSTRSRY